MKTFVKLLLVVIILTAVYLFYIRRSNNSNVPTVNNNKEKFTVQKSIKNIRASMWPYPNSITRNTQSSDVTYLDIPSDMSSFKSYVAELDENCDSPLSDFKDYAASISPKRHPNSVSMKFKVDMKTSSYNLGDKTKDTYQNDEKYTLKISSNGMVQINAQTYIGVGYAITTLQQLLSTDDEGHCFIRSLPITVNDSPNTFRRYTMLDTSRNYFSTDCICSLIKVMGYNKLNNFDWHITDNQSFPLNIGPVSKIFSVTPSTDPNFRGMTGAFDVTKSYSTSDVKRIIGTARNYGIAVQPGIDTPGHCSSLMYGSKQATKYVCGLREGFQMIKGWEYKYQSSGNAPEPIIGYLDLESDLSKATPRTDNIVKVIHALMDEIHNVFEFNTGRYGNCYNLNADEVNEKILSLEVQQNYMNKILDKFETDSNWINVDIAMWIDPILASNITPDNEYTDNIQLKRFDGRICIGLWNLWPLKNFSKNYDAIMGALSNSEAVNYNSDYLYLDAGAANVLYSGYTMKAGDHNQIMAQSNAYWIGASPIVANQWGAFFRGFPTNFGKIYLYNYKWDFTGTGLSDNTVSKTIVAGGTTELKNVTGAGVAIWTETIDEGTLFAKTVHNIAALSEMTWKYFKKIIRPII